MFYVSEIRGNRAEIRGDTARHMRKVLRVEPGMKFEVSDQRELWLAEVTGFGKDVVELALLERQEAVPAPVRSHLLASLIKFDHFEWMLEKAVELGVERITPVQAIRSEKGLEVAALKRMDRWQRILDESGQQSRRLAPPKLSPPVELASALQAGGVVRLWLEEEHGAPVLLSALPSARAWDDEVAVLVGPEGGWDPRERDLAAANGWTAVTLGPQVLRAETAAISSLAVINASWLVGTRSE